MGTYGFLSLLPGVSGIFINIVTYFKFFFIWWLKILDLKKIFKNVFFFKILKNCQIFFHFSKLQILLTSRLVVCKTRFYLFLTWPWFIEWPYQLIMEECHPLYSSFLRMHVPFSNSRKKWSPFHHHNERSPINPYLLSAFVRAVLEFESTNL